MKKAIELVGFVVMLAAVARASTYMYYVTDETLNCNNENSNGNTTEYPTANSTAYPTENSNIASTDNCCMNYSKIAVTGCQIINEDNQTCGGTYNFTLSRKTSNKNTPTPTINPYNCMSMNCTSMVRTWLKLEQRSR